MPTKTNIANRIVEPCRTYTTSLPLMAGYVTFSAGLSVPAINVIDPLDLKTVLSPINMTADKYVHELVEVKDLKLQVYGINGQADFEVATLAAATPLKTVATGITVQIGQGATLPPEFTLTYTAVVKMFDGKLVERNVTQHFITADLF